MISCSGSLLFNQTYWHPTQSPTRSNNKCWPCPAPCFSFTDRRGRAVSNCTFDLIGSAVQCTAVKADKSFFQSLEKWLPTEWPEDTGRNKESIVFWPVFVFCWNCEGANGWCSLKQSWWVCVHPLQGLCGFKEGLWTAGTQNARTFSVSQDSIRALYNCHYPLLQISRCRSASSSLQITSHLRQIDQIRQLIHCREPGYF